MSEAATGGVLEENVSLNIFELCWVLAIAEYFYTNKIDSCFFFVFQICVIS